MMFGFSMGDWLFIAGVMLVIIVCVAISDLRMRK
jgi:hypothetical protein